MKLFEKLNKRLTINKMLAFALAIMMSSWAFAQDRMAISGQILDDNEEALIGATIVEKGTTNGTITDLSGNYKLEVAGESSVIVISSLGFETQEILVGVQTVINSHLDSDVAALEEVVVVGYGTQKKASVSGSIVSVGQEAFQSRNSPNPMAALQGQIPGLAITRTSGQPGEEGFNMQIRGMSSLNVADPLIILDGVPYTASGSISSLNPNDIESLTVLRDASAAIYGARAAGGVILITTKKGVSGKPVISYNAKFTSKTPGLDKTLTNRRQYFEMFKEASDNAGVANNWERGGYEDYFLNGHEGAISPTNFGGEYPLDQTFADNNWQDVLWGSSTMWSHNLSIAGGGEKMDYRISLGLSDDQGLLRWGENYAQRRSIRTNLGFQISDKVKASVVISYENEFLKEPTQMNRVLADFDPPFIEVTNPLGQPYSWHGKSNPAWMAELGGETDEAKNRFGANLQIDADLSDLVEGLKAVAVVGGRMWLKDQDIYSNAVDHYNWEGVVVATHPVLTQASRYNEELKYHNSTGYLNYSKTLATKHFFKIMVGGSFEQRDFRSFSAERDNLISNEIHTINTGSSDTQRNTAGASSWAITSNFARLNYDYDGKYFLEANARRDGSSRFAAGLRNTNFGGVSAAWRASEEDFMSGVPFINNLKLRASIGSVGNQSGINVYDYVQIIRLSDNFYPFGESATQTNYAENQNVVSLDRTWERVITKNVGIDFGVLDGRLTGSFDYFLKDNPNMLVNATYSEVLGASSPATNSGHLKTTGVELTLGWADKIGDIGYNISAVYFDNTTELLKMEGADAYTAGLVNTRVGFPINSYFGYKSEGFILSEQELTDYLALGNVNQSLSVGDAKYADLNEDGKISEFADDGSEGDIVFLGDANPHHQIALNLGANYKGFDFGVVFQGVLKQDFIRNTNLTLASPFRRWWLNQNSVFYNNTWSEDRPNAEHPRITRNASVRNWNYQYSSRLVQSAAYLRLKTLIVGYTLPQAVVDRAGIGSARVYFSGYDLWETTSIKDGFDPEKALTSTSNPSYHPFVRTFTLGLDLTF